MGQDAERAEHYRSILGGLGFFPLPLGALHNVKWRKRYGNLNYIEKGDFRLSGPPSDPGACGSARTSDRRVPADLRADSLATVPPTLPFQKIYVPKSLNDLGTYIIDVLKKANSLVARKSYTYVINQGYDDFTYESLTDMFNPSANYRGLPSSALSLWQQECLLS
ncbi:hypothetical protein PoB_005880900 [Plakobranchus ocellatus]|uniref:Uncharacterized protein n=1 Tax=Plakobranchus ocellatus TaxID=259542 RepID=A0AAV4CLV7_9GAST|nr:hypothetical protein PoB_005880900 [Plakobranchus ocellatus]